MFFRVFLPFSFLFFDFAVAFTSAGALLRAKSSAGRADTKDPWRLRMLSSEENTSAFNFHCSFAFVGFAFAFAL